MPAVVQPSFFNFSVEGITAAHSDAAPSVARVVPSSILPFGMQVFGRKPGNGFISGVVTKTGGFANAAVLLDANTGAPLAYAAAGSAGTYRFDRLNIGKYVVAVVDTTNRYRAKAIHTEYFDVRIVNAAAESVVQGTQPLPLNATDGEPPYTFGLLSGAIPGLTLNGNGTWTGTASSPGSYAVNAQTTDAGGRVASKSITYNVQSLTASRSWRMLCYHTNDVTSHSSIAELEMRSSLDLSGANLLTGGVASASSQHDSSHAVGYAFDGIKNATTIPECWAAANTSLPQWAGYKTATAVEVNHVQVTARYLSPAQSPRGFLIQRSNDDWATNTTEMAIHDQTGWTPNQIRNFVRASANTAKRWWGILIEAPETSGFSMASLELRNVAGGTDFGLTGTGATATSTYSGAYLPAYAFDNNSGTFWASAADGAMQLLGIQLAANQLINHVSLRTRGDNGTAYGQGAKRFHVVSSTDGVTWVREWTVDNQTGWVGGEIRSFARP